jgi:hypothetical protein
VGTEEYSIARGGPTCVRATHPICISVERQLRGGRASQEEAKIQGAPWIIQGVSHGGEVGLPRIMHVEANLLDDVGDVRMGERQILEGPS